MVRDDAKDPTLAAPKPTALEPPTVTSPSGPMSIARLRGIEALVMGAQGVDAKALGLVVKLCALVESALSDSPQHSSAQLKVNTIYSLAPTLFSDAGDKEREHARVGILAATASLRSALK